jgi:hypothetical protein
MTDNLWVKAAGAAFALLTGIASWGLLRTVDVKDQVVTVSGRVDVLDTRLEIWTTMVGKPMLKPAVLRREAREPDVYYASAPYQGDKAALFAQKAMVAAAEQILRNDAEGALKTLIVGLDATGLSCVPSGDHLECR